MNTVDVLKAAKALIADPEHWCQFNFAVDASGHPTAPEDPAACRRCAMGALHAVGAYGKGPIEKLAEASKERGFPFIAEFNDTHGHAEIMRLFDRAIALAGGE